MKKSAIDWSVATQAFPGAGESGDAYAVKTFANQVLAVAVDGLGHGAPAAVAARRAIEVLCSRPVDHAVSLIRKCHVALRETRGVVFSLAILDAECDSMTWLGIGNVEGILKRAHPNGKPSHESLFLSSGVLGYNLHAIRTSVLPIGRGDTLVFATDGIRSGFASEVRAESSPREIAGRIIESYGKDSDDALVLVVRYLGKVND